MQKKLAPKVPTKKEILASILEGNLEDVLRLEDLNIDFCDEEVGRSMDWDKALEKCDMEHEGNTIVVTYGEASIQAQFTEQLSCCANILVHNFLGNLHGIDGQIAIAALFKLLHAVAEEDGYSFVWFTHIKNTDYVKNALVYGFTTTRTYKNLRTGNTLVDLHLAV